VKGLHSHVKHMDKNTMNKRRVDSQMKGKRREFRRR